MKNLLIAVTLAGCLALAGCSTGTESDSECPDGYDPEFRTDIHGLSLIEATQAVQKDGGTIRVTYRNGEHLAATEDYNEDRVNVALDHNIVICAFKG